MIVRRGVEFWVLSGDSKKVLGRYKTRALAAAYESELLSKASPNGVPAKQTGAQLYIVLKSRAPTLASAMSLVRKHGGIIRGSRQTADSWRFKQAEKEVFEEGSHYTEELEAGVFVVIAKPLEEELYGLFAGAQEEAFGLEADRWVADLLGSQPGPSAFGGAFSYDALGGLVGPEGQGLENEAFPCVPYGKVQFLRTGSGFWRQDHGAPFAIDRNLLKLILKNTQIRSRPLRGDFMHWTDLSAGQPAQYRACGYANPADLFIGKWTDPQVATQEFGIFGPVAWTEESALLISKGLNQISPVIDWQYTLRHDTGTHVAGTFLGPTIVKFALVDEGFFWMDSIRLYKEHESRASFLYRERV